MRNVLSVTLWLLLVGYGQLVRAQTQPIQCTNQFPNPPTLYTGWDWETTPFQAAYCDTWAAYTKTTISSQPIKQSMGAPWVNPGSRELVRIGETMDYRRVNGWELVKLDFGGNNGTLMPSFILYNKYTGILRVFAWLNSSQTFSRAIMTMSSAPGSQSNAQVTAVSGLSQPLLLGPDQYLAQNRGDDLTTYICGFGGSQGWIMGEFTMLFDPNYSDPKFYESKLEFNIYGIVNSFLKLAGDFRFTTQPQEGFGFAGSASQLDANPGSGVKQFLTKSAKFLGKFSSANDQNKTINTKAKETRDALATTTSKPLQAVRSTASFVEKITGNGWVKGLLGTAAQAAGAFSFLGSVAGILWPDEQSAAAPAPPAPTVSTGSISLSGSIETSTLLGQVVYVQVPGTPHNFTTSNAQVRMIQPYYDCPMGLFNIRYSPRVRRIDYPRPTVRNGNRGQVPEQMYSSYVVDRNLESVFNQTANVQVVSVQAALVQKVSYNSLASGTVKGAYNYMFYQALAGSVEAVPYDNGPTSSPEDDTYLVQTPFVNATCFKDMAFNAPTDSLTKNPLFVRVVATLRRNNAPANAAPIYFSQDYALETVSTTSSNRSYLDVQDVPPYYFGEPRVIPADVLYTGPVFQANGQFFQAPANLVFDYNSSLKMDVTRNGGSQGFGGGSGGFTAGYKIDFSGTLDVPVGMEVAFSTDRVVPFYRNCVSPGPAPQGVGSCNGYNQWATPTRPVATPPSGPVVGSASEGVLSVAPNPAMHSTTVRLTKPVPATGIEQVWLCDLQGRVLRQHTVTEKSVAEATVDLRGVPVGLYIIRVVSEGKYYFVKLQIH